MRSYAFLSRLVATASLLSLIGLSWTLFAAPLRNWKQTQITAYDQSLAEHARLKKSIMRLKSERDAFPANGPSDFVWPARQKGELTAMVQSQVNAIAFKSDVTLRTVTPIPSRELQFIGTVAVRIEAEVNLDRLIIFLLELESNKPALLVDRANLRRLNRATADSLQPLIFVQLDVIAPKQGTGS